MVLFIVAYSSQIFTITFFYLAIASETRDTVLVERKAPPIIDYAVRIISKHILASFP